MEGLSIGSIVGVGRLSMEVGDLVEIRCAPFVGEVGMIINVCLAASKEKDKFVVTIRNRHRAFSRRWLTKVG